MILKSWQKFLVPLKPNGIVISSLRPGCDLLGYDMLVIVISLETLETLTDNFRRPADMSQSHETTITIVYLLDGNFGP